MPKCGKSKCGNKLSNKTYKEYQFIYIDFTNLKFSKKLFSFGLRDAFALQKDLSGTKKTASDYQIVQNKVLNEP